MREAGADLGVSGGVVSKSTCERGCEAAADLGVSGGVESKSTCRLLPHAVGRC
jgi:hypothetical protein